MREKEIKLENERYIHIHSPSFRKRAFTIRNKFYFLTTFASATDLHIFFLLRKDSEEKLLQYMQEMERKLREQFQNEYQIKEEKERCLKEKLKENEAEMARKTEENEEYLRGRLERIERENAELREKVLTTGFLGNIKKGISSIGKSFQKIISKDPKDQCAAPVTSI